MKGILRKSVSLIALVAMIMAIVGAPIQASAAGAPVKITILETSDLHGNIFPTDYYTGKPANVGLAAAATVIKQVRAENPNTLLIDCGDTIQGTPLIAYYNKLTDVPNPMADVMNYLNYDAATLGNHEFNFGSKVLDNYTNTAKYPIIAANVLKADGTPAYTPYIIKDVQGIKVGILGLTNQAIPTWEQPENYAGLHFQSQVEAAQKWVPVLRDTEKCDVVIVDAHSGPEANLAQDVPNKGAAGTPVSGTAGESELYALSQVAGIDVVLGGHLHADFAVTMPNGTIVIEPKNLGSKVGRVDLTMEQVSGKWAITAKNAQTLAVDGAKADADVLAYAKNYNDTTLTYVNTVVGQSTGEFSGATSQTSDSAVMDLVNKIQLDISKADMSLAASFSTTSLIPKGDVRIKDVASVYIYENYLYVIEATGAQIKEALENSANFFNQYDGKSPLVNPSVRGYNYDMLYGPGVTYKIDLTKPAGQRIVGLTYQGKPMDMNKTFKLAINNYRATGGGYATFKNCKILSKASTEIREQIIDYFKSHPSVSPVNDNHWTLLPDYVNNNHWAKPSLDLLFNNNIITLDKNSSFNPDQRITQADFTTMVSKAFGAAAGKTNSGNITRQDAIGQLVSAAGIELVTPPAGAFKNFTDAKQISTKLTTAIWSAIQSGVIKGDAGALRPTAFLTRAEAATMIANARFRPISILSTNDVHGGATIQVDKTLGNVGGSATVATYVNQARAKNPHGTLLLDAGDPMQGTPTSNLYYGKSMIEIMNAIGYDAMTIGNHEFDWTTARLAEREADAKFPVLSANIFEKATGNRPAFAKPYTMIEKNGLKIGVIGITSTETPTIVLYDNIKDYEVRNPIPYVNEFAKELRAQGADLIVVDAHEGGAKNADGTIGGTIGNLAKFFVGVDAIVGGHVHATLAGTASGIPFVSNLDKGKGIGDIELRYDVVKDVVVSAAESTIVTKADGVTPDAAVKAIVDKYEAEVAPLMNKVIGKTDVDLTRNYNGESAIGNLMTDIMRAAVGTDFAFTNAGGIRVDLPAGNLTNSSIYQVMPFDNTLCTMDLTGQQIKDILEQGCKLLKGQIQISGLKFEYNASLPEGSRVTKMTKADGTEIALDATYSIVTNDFMMGGGDNYVTFKDATNKVNTYRLIRDEMIKWIQAETDAGRVIHPVVDGRVTEVK